MNICRKDEAKENETGSDPFKKYCYVMGWNPARQLHWKFVKSNFWQSGHFRYKRTQVRIQPSAILIERLICFNLHKEKMK